MADDDIFAGSGYVRKQAAVAPAAPNTGDIFSDSGYQRNSATSHDALENSMAQGVNKSEPAKPGRGIWQALKDYPAHVLGGVADTVKAPGTVMTANPYPEGSEEHQFFEDSRSKAIETSAPQLAGLVSGSEFPKVGAATALEKVSPASRSVNALVDAVGPENVPAAVNRLQQNPRLTLADVSDPVRTMAQGLIDPAQPKAQNAIVEAVKQRAGSRLEAANTAFTEAMGPAPDVVKMVEGLKDRARAAGREAIQPALTNAKAVDVSPVIAAIDKEVQPGIAAMKSGLPLSPRQEELWRLRNQIVNSDTGEQLVDPARLHEIQSRNGDLAYQYQKSPDGKTKNIGNGLRDVNEKLVDAIDEASGGSYRPARAKFKDAKDISEAFESGFDTLKNRSGLNGALEDSPQAFKEWMRTATPEEIVSRRLGTRADIDQKINSVKNGALKGETITSIPYNQEKLRALFGDGEANRLIRVMKDSADEATTNAKLLMGAKTAETQAGQRALAVPKVEPFRLGSLTQALLPSTLAEVAGSYLGAPTGLTAVGLIGSGLVAGGIKAGAQSFRASNALARNAEFAKRALATGSTRQETLNALLSHPKVIRELNKRSNALAAP